jgi:hypothetical protein
MSIVAKDLVMKLQSLLEEKKAAMESIHSLTLEQKEDIEKNQGENLNSFIDKKQTEIEKIQTIDESFQDAVILLKKELDIEVLDDINPNIYPEFKSIKELTEQILGLAKKIMELEEQNKIKVQDILNSIRKDIKTVKLGQKSVKAYEKSNLNTGGIYIDSKK